MANKIKVGRATKARIEEIKGTLDNYELVYSLDTKELGVKNSDGTITYIGVVTEIEWANVLNKPTFAAVATSGAYEDLTGKPNLDLKLDKDFSALPEQTNPLLTDVLVLNRGTTAQKVTLGSLLAQVDDEIFQVVSALPATGAANKIYLVPSSNPETQNVLDEFIWVDNDWEKIGAVSVDLSNYFNKSEINAMLEGKVDKNAPITPGTSTKITYDAKGLVTGGGSLVASDIPSLDASKITSGTFAAARIPNLDASKITSGVFNVARIPSLAISKITDLQDVLDDLESNKVDKVPGKGLSTNDYTDADKSKVDSIDQVYTLAEKNKLAGIEAGAQKNVQADWNATSGDAFIKNKPTIPSKTSQLVNDSDFATNASVDSKIAPIQNELNKKITMNTNYTAIRKEYAIGTILPVYNSVTYPSRIPLGGYRYIKVRYYDGSAVGFAEADASDPDRLDGWWVCIGQCGENYYLFQRLY